jgi:hypothetical protein
VYRYGKKEDDVCYPDLKSLHEKPDVIITVVPPRVTEAVVRVCRELGIRKIRMQPGSESGDAIDSAGLMTWMLFIAAVLWWMDLWGDSGGDFQMGGFNYKTGCFLYPEVIYIITNYFVIQSYLYNKV